MIKIPFDVDKMYKEIKEHPERYPTLSQFELEQFRDLVDFGKIFQASLPVLYEMNQLVDNIS